MCRYGIAILDLSAVVSQTTGPGDIPHRRGSGSGTGPRILGVWHRTRRSDDKFVKLMVYFGKFAFHLQKRNSTGPHSFPCDLFRGREGLSI